jgi:hypothetical protein
MRDRRTTLKNAMERSTISARVTKRRTDVPRSARHRREIREQPAASGVLVTDHGLTFTGDLSEHELRNLWRRLIAARNELGASPDWLLWAQGDWGNEVDRRLGAGAAERIAREEAQLTVSTPVRDATRTAERDGHAAFDDDATER